MEQLIQEVSRLCRYVIWELELLCADVRVELLVVLPSEWELTAEESVQ